MNSLLTPQSLLEQILQIKSMEHGSLSIIRQGPNGPYYSLNSWEDGKNQCRYIPQDKISDVQNAIAGFNTYQQLTEQYARQVVEKTRDQLSIGVKKKEQPPEAAGPRIRQAQEEEIE